VQAFAQPDAAKLLTFKDIVSGITSMIMTRFMSLFRRHIIRLMIDISGWNGAVVRISHWIVAP